MKTIDTLTKDIYELFDSTKDHKPTAEGSEVKATLGIQRELLQATSKRESTRIKGKLWASDLGKACLRQHYYKFNSSEEAEPLEGHTKFKFLYGNLLEETVLFYAKESGHSVSLPQERVETDIDGWKISGRIDGVVDGVLIDVKSTSSYGYKRYKDGINYTNDSFGYIDQLGFYTAFNNFQPQPTTAGFIWIDKQNGHIKFTECSTPNKEQLEQKARNIIKAVDTEESNVARGYSPEPYGKSGNLKLPIGCAYCPFKQHCYRDSNNGKGLRGFLYSHGPVWFTDIQREPRSDVLEISK